MKAIVGGKIIIENEIITDKVLVFDEKIQAITESVPEHAEIIELNGEYVAPGFINIHIHGAKGADIMDGTIQSVKTISDALVKNGITSYLATTMTMSKAHIFKAMQSIRDYMLQAASGAKVLGVHVEGPFISEQYKGAQDPNNIIEPDFEIIDSYADIIKLVTVAPEIKGMISFINQVKEKHPHIKFSIGHSAASYEEAVNAYENGIDSTTHLFNAMTGLHHRKPGIVGAAFKKKPFVELIADKIHCHEALFDIVGDTLGLDKMILVTDSMCACQMPQGEYALGGQKVIVDHNSARLESGALAGSILEMNEAISNVLNGTHYDLQDVLQMVTINPSSMLGINHIGRIKENYSADLVVLDDDMTVKMTLVDGQIRFRKE